MKDREGKGSCHDQLVFDERIASLGTLAAGFAHEINNPLADLSIQLELLEEEIPALVTDPLSRRELTKLVTQAIEGAQRIRKFSQGLQLFSRAPDDESCIFELHEVIEQSIDVCFHEIRQRASLVKLFEDLPCIRGNSARLGQVFVHLLMNAAEAISAGERDENEITISTRTDEASHVVVTVHDTGCGVPKELQTRIFEPFFTTKDIGQGMGVGLSVSHSIVAEMGGKLSVESQPGQGCTFTVVLPTTRAEESVVQSPAPSKQTTGASILVVDDEPTIGRVMARALRDHEVTSVTTAHEALSLLESGRTFDVIFSDLMMPDISGVQFYEAIESRFPAFKRSLVFVTGGTLNNEARRFINEVTTPVLAKPFSIVEVRQLVQLRSGENMTH